MAAHRSFAEYVKKKRDSIIISGQLPKATWMQTLIPWVLN